MVPLVGVGLAAAARQHAEEAMPRRRQQQRLQRRQQLLRPVGERRAVERWSEHVGQARRPARLAIDPLEPGLAPRLLLRGRGVRHVAHGGQQRRHQPRVKSLALDDVAGPQELLHVGLGDAVCRQRHRCGRGRLPLRHHFTTPLPPSSRQCNINHTRVEPRINSFSPQAIIARKQPRKAGAPRRQALGPLLSPGTLATAQA